MPGGTGGSIFAFVSFSGLVWVIPFLVWVSVPASTALYRVGPVPHLSVQFGWPTRYTFSFAIFISLGHGVVMGFFVVTFF